MPTLIATKVGMTRIFTEMGVSIPVTVLQFSKHQVVQLKTVDKDGYNAYQIGTKITKSLNKPEKGHLESKGLDVSYGNLYEAGIQDFSRELSQGESLDVSEFDGIDWVDVSGLTKGRGFTGVVKRWNFKTQPASHGNSLSGRVPGSIGANQDPGRVWKNKKMPGHYGHTQVSVQNLKVVQLDKERGLLLVKGAVPGANGFSLVVRRAVKK